MLLICSTLCPLIQESIFSQHFTPKFKRIKNNLSVKPNKLFTEISQTGFLRNCSLFCEAGVLTGQIETNLNCSKPMKHIIILPIRFSDSAPWSSKLILSVLTMLYFVHTNGQAHNYNNYTYNEEVSIALKFE